MGKYENHRIDMRRRCAITELALHLSGIYVSLAIVSPARSTTRTTGPKADGDSSRKALRSELGARELPLILPETLSSLEELSIPVSNMMVSEKLDGVRAYWNGSQLFFRSGRVINAPAWFTKDFPRAELDGELWMARGKFEQLSAAVRRQQADDKEWRQIVYCLFELPHAEGDFEQRYLKLKDITAGANIPWLRTVEQRVFQHRAELQAHFNQTVRNKAEGIVLHLTNSEFETGRSKKLYKFKPYFDAEAVILKYIPGTGKLAGKMGALLVENRDGIRFRLGSGFSDELRQTPPAIGSWISYRYRDLTGGGLPRFPTYLRAYEAD